MNEVTTETDAGTITDDNLERAAQAFPAQDVATVERGQPLALASQGEQVRSMILDLARDSTFDVEKLRALTEMQERAEDRQAQRLFAIDMAAAQSECQAVVRNAEVKLGKEGENKGGYKYAALEDIDDMIRPIMTRYGFSVTYDRVPRQADGGGFVVTGTLWHRGGHSITASFPLPLDSGPGRGNLQAAGSTDTYGQKYILIGFFRIVRKGSDDDGAMAGIRTLRELGDEGRKKGVRIKELVDNTGIAAHAENANDRKAAIMGWFNDPISYPLNDYLDIREEDYGRIVRLLRIEVDNHKREQEQEAQL